MNFNRLFVTICIECRRSSLVEKSRIRTCPHERAISRLASEIVEENHGAKELYIVGIRRRGVTLAERIVDKIETLEGQRPFTELSILPFIEDDLSTVGANRS